MDSGSVAAIVPAAGRGDRLGPGPPKALRPVRGVPMLVYAVHAVAESRQVQHVAIAAPPTELADMRAALSDFQFAADVDVVTGGATRQESVRLALSTLPADVTSVLVHDAARPLVPVDVVDRVLAALRTGAAAVVPVLPVYDTIKEVDEDVVTRTLDRAILRAVQTPQGFRRNVIEEAHAKAAIDGGVVATDDAGLVERLGVPVISVAGSPESFKVTTPTDLLLAEALIAKQRVGFGR